MELKVAVDWAAVSSIATAASAGVAAASAVVIAWQARETRRASQAAVESVDLGRSALIVSQSATVEATKTRLDARAPKLRVTPVGELFEDVYILRGDKWDKWSDPKDLLRRTRDDAVRIRVAVDFAIANEGAASVYVRIVPRRLGMGEEFRSVKDDPDRQLLGPGESLTQRMEAVATLERWSQGQEDPSGKRRRPVFVYASLICGDLYDEGVVDKWVLKMTARPVARVSDDLSAWRVRDLWDGLDVITASALHQERMYFLSKHRKERLGSPDYAEESERGEENTLQARISTVYLKKGDPSEG